MMTNCPKCNISYTAGRFFSCLGTDSDQTVVFLAQIVYQYIRDSPTNPLSLLQSWVSSGPLLTVFQQQLRVNSACQVERLPDTAPQCNPDPPISPPPSSSTAIIATVCVLFAMVFLVAVTVVIVLILCIRRWKRNRYVVCTTLHVTFHVTFHMNFQLLCSGKPFQLKRSTSTCTQYKVHSLEGWCTALLVTALKWTRTLLMSQLRGRREAQREIMFTTTSQAMPTSGRTSPQMFMKKVQTFKMGIV